MYSIEFNCTNTFTTNSYAGFIKKLVKKIAVAEEVNIVINFSKEALRRTDKPKSVIDDMVDFFKYTNDDDVIINNINIAVTVNDDIEDIKSIFSSMKYNIMFDNDGDFDKDSLVVFKDAGLISSQSRTLARHYTALSAFLGVF